MAAGGSQGVTQVSVLGQCGALLLPQLLRRLRTHSEHESSFTLNEDVLARGTYFRVFVPSMQINEMACMNQALQNRRAPKSATKTLCVFDTLSATIETNGKHAQAMLLLRR